MALSNAILIAFQFQLKGTANNKAQYYVHFEMLREARGIDNSSNQFALSGPEHAICLINGYYFFSVKINAFIIVFHQILFVPCLSIQGKVFSISPMCW